jgi:Calx-beta domain/Lamin Tail Domain/Divergent InlB B-repeat domain
MPSSTKIKRSWPLVVVGALVAALVVPSTARAAAPVLTITNVSVLEGNSGTKAAVFEVKLSRAIARKANVRFATRVGTAKLADFAAKTGTITFLPGQRTKKIAVAIKGDLLDEAVEKFTVKLSSPTRAVIKDGTGVGTINDNDPLPTLSRDSAEFLAESVGTTNTLTVDLGATSGKTVTVDYATQDGTADGTDYNATSGTLTFLPGEMQKNIPLTIVDDAIAEGTESFDVNFTDPVNATMPVTSITMNIADNEEFCDGMDNDGDTVTDNGVCVVTVSVNGQGVVTSDPPGIVCPSDCDHNFPGGGGATLNADPADGHNFVGWSGGCTGTSLTCSPLMDTPVSATFAPEGLVINEVDYDNPSTDTTEFIELFNSTSSPYDLSNLAVVLGSICWARFPQGATWSSPLRP